MFLKVLFCSFLIFMILFLLFIGRILCKDIEDPVSMEVHKDEEGRMFGYSLYFLALMCFCTLWWYL